MERYSAIETHCIMNGKEPLGGIYPQCKLSVKRMSFYVLTDRGGAPFYIGCTTGSLKARFSNHKSQAKDLRYSDKRAAKIRSLKHDFKIKELEVKYIVGETTKRILTKAAAREVYWMCYYLEKGSDIVNQVITKKHRVNTAA